MTRYKPLKIKNFSILWFIIISSYIVEFMKCPGWSIVPPCPSCLTFLTFLFINNLKLRINPTEWYNPLPAMKKKQWIKHCVRVFVFLDSITTVFSISSKIHTKTASFKRCFLAYNSFGVQGKFYYMKILYMNIYSSKLCA